MKFDAEQYEQEMKSLVDEAIGQLQYEKPDFVIYTCSIWTDPEARVSSINFDSEENSRKQAARTLLVIPGAERNSNPADFELRDYREVAHQSFWCSRTSGDEQHYWDVLEPALRQIGAYAFRRLQALRVHPELEVAVNGRHDWYEFTWNLNQQ